MSGGTRIAAIRLRCRDVAATAAFYMRAFGCTAAETMPDGLALHLGHQRLELVGGATEVAEPAPGNSTAFQHFAIAVSDMDEAIRALGRVPGWTAITRGGPQQLPPASGGATSFKFRDPENHPLELLRLADVSVPQFWQKAAEGAMNPFLGIDHSAISVEAVAASIAFYSARGFAESGRQINRGPEQERLDNLSGAEVEVVALDPAGGAPPHLELLSYRAPPMFGAPVHDSSSLATQIVLTDIERSPAEPFGRESSDPDGHRLAVRGD